MRDTSALEARIKRNVLDKCFNTIVCEAFLGAVPIDDKDMSHGLKRDLIDYAVESLQDAGGYDILVRAMKNTDPRYDPMAYGFLKGIESVCMEAAISVTERVIDELGPTDDEKLISAAADKASMTPKEYERFTKGASKISDQKLSDIIKNKVIDTIKEEKEAYQKDTELETEIKDAVAGTTEDQTSDTDKLESPFDATSPAVATNDDSSANNPNPDDAGSGVMEESPVEELEANANEAFTRYMTSAYGRNFRHRHETVFSRLQELALESVLYTTEKYDYNYGLPLKTAGLITRRKTFPIFESANSKNPIMALESICRLAVESVATPDSPAPNEDPHPQNTALMTAAIIYTFFETLNSMHLYCPGMDELRAFVDSHVPMSQMVNSDKEAFMADLKSLVSRAMGNVQKAVALPELDGVEREMDAVREACNRSGTMESYMTEIDTKFGTVKSAIAAKRKIIKDKMNIAPAVESEMQLMRRTRDTMKFNRTASSYGRKHNVHSIRCKVDSNGTPAVSKYIAVECYDGSGHMVNRSTVVLEQAMEGQKVPEYVESLIKASNLMNLDKPITISDSHTGKIFFSVNQ